MGSKVIHFVIFVKLKNMGEDRYGMWGWEWMGSNISNIKIFCSKMDHVWVTYHFLICTQALDECMCIMGSFWSAELQKCCLAQQTWG